MAPRVIPKLRPMPAIIGIKRDMTRKLFLLSLVIISFIIAVPEKPEKTIPIPPITMNMIGTILLRRNVPAFFPDKRFPFIILPPTFL